MYLVKSCFRPDNIWMRRTLRIGSLDEYRQTEEEQIADAEEGTIKHIYNLQNFHMPDELMKALTEHSNADTSFHLKHVTFAGRSALFKNHLFLKAYEAETNLSHFNRFAFCISKLSSPSLAKGIFEHYDDEWHFPVSRARFFAEALSGEILLEVSRRLSSGEEIFQSPPKSLNLQISWHVEEISYTQRQIFINNAYLYLNHQFVMKSLRHSYMIKPNLFAHENEVRFIFNIFCDGTLLIPKQKSLIVNAAPVLPFINLV